MIVLDRMSEDAREARLLELEPVGPGAAGGAAGPDEAAIRAVLERMGYGDLDLGGGDAPDVAGPRAGMRWMHDGESLHYYADFPHEAASEAVLQRFLAVAMATFGLPREADMLQLRLAVVELCSNILEHGELLVPVARLRVHLAWGHGVLEGDIQDGCAWFDPTREGHAAPRDRFRLRARRGFGLIMVQRILDEIEHEYTGQGNLVRFRKVVQR